LPVEEFTANGELSLNCLSHPRGQAQLALSSLSLALQIKESSLTLPFEKFMGPARISDFDLRVVRADQEMMRDSVPTSDGIGVPFIRELSDDHKQIIVRVLVAEKSLPKNHDELKQALENQAYEAIAVIASEFDLRFDPSENRAVRAEFISLMARIKDPKSVYADFTGGVLTFH
jgi:hypothetical protein